jgi:hypothetical protein
VDVHVTIAPFDQAVHDCLEEATWDTLIASPNAPEHATTTLAFPRYAR